MIIFSLFILPSEEGWRCDETKVRNGDIARCNFQIIVDSSANAEKTVAEKTVMVITSTKYIKEFVIFYPFILTIFFKFFVYFIYPVL